MLIDVSGSDTGETTPSRSPRTNLPAPSASAAWLDTIPIPLASALSTTTLIATAIPTAALSATALALAAAAHAAATFIASGLWLRLRAWCLLRRARTILHADGTDQGGRVGVQHDNHNYHNYYQSYKVGMVPFAELARRQKPPDRPGCDGRVHQLFA